MTFDTAEQEMAREGKMPEVPPLAELEGLAREAFAAAGLGRYEPQVSFGEVEHYGRTVKLSLAAADGIHTLQLPLYRGELGRWFRYLAREMAASVRRSEGARGDPRFWVDDLPVF